MNTLQLTTLYLVRHGQTDWNVKGIIQGQQNSHLTDEGIEQARSLSQEFKDIHFQAAYASDLERAVKTAEIVAAPHHLKPIHMAGLRERCAGVLEGKSVQEKRDLYGGKVIEFEELNEDDRLDYRLAEGMETDNEVLDRLLPALHTIADRHQGETVLVVSHGAAMRILLYHLGFATHKQLAAGSIRNTGYVKLVSDGKSFKVVNTEGISLYSPPSKSSSELV